MNHGMDDPAWRRPAPRLGVAVCLATTIALGFIGCQSGPAGGREIKIAITEKGFEPSEIHVKKGEKVVLAFTRQTQVTCATEVVIGDDGTPKPLPLNQTVLVPLGPVSGDTKFACAMNMYHGVVHAD